MTQPKIETPDELWTMQWGPEYECEECERLCFGVPCEICSLCPWCCRCNEGE